MGSIVGFGEHVKAPDFSERFSRLLTKRRRGERWMGMSVACVLEVLALDVARLAFLAGMREGLRFTPRRVGYTVAQARREGDRLWFGGEEVMPMARPKKKAKGKRTKERA